VSAPAPAVPTPVAPLKAGGNIRWGVCALLFFATTINYIDRQVLSILKPLLEDEFGWSEADYGWIASLFTFGYALMMPIAGRLIDKLGARIGYALAVAAWSLASMSHAAASSVVHFGIARFALGMTEAANFPGAVRTVADWFPQRERSLATGIFNSGSNVGLVLAAGAPFVALSLGWQVAFLLTGLLGLLWLIPWLIWYRRPEEHPRLKQSELAYIVAERPHETARRIPYRELLAHRGSWAFMAGKFMTDPVWWFFIFWIPSFLHSRFDVNLTAMGPPLLVIYLMADVGSIGGGWLFKGLKARGWSANAARKGAMAICAACALPVTGILFVESVWPAVMLIAVAAAAHQGWSANLFTLVSDTTPRPAVASVVGLGGLCGAAGGVLIAPLVGYWLDYSNANYIPLFLIGATAYLSALLIIQLIVPQLEQPVAMELEESA
jgi:ACS family hexuronate transporter-like MFS transporter